MLGLELESLDGVWLVAIIMGTLKLLFEIGKVYKSYQENRYYSLDKIKEAFETEKIDNNLREQLVNTYEKDIFYKVYRLNIEKEYRNKILNISKNSYEIECSTFRRAGKYIDYKNQDIFLTYRYLYPIEKLINKISAYIYYAIFGFFIIGFLAYSFNYEDLLRFYIPIGSKYILLFLGFYALLGSFLCLKKEVALDAVIILKNYADLYQNDIEIIHKELLIDKIVKNIFQIS